jgi:hypothetical protein
MMSRQLLALLAATNLSLVGTLHAEAPEKILFVGNSYTGQVREMVSKFFAASPHKEIELEFIAPGGRTLAQHLKNESTVKRINEGGWAIIVLQDQSQTPAVFPEKFLDASQKLNAIIDKAGAKTAYYQTWGRRDGDKANAKRFPTYLKMQAALSKSYEKAAKRDEAILVTVGEAWRLVRKENPELGTGLYKKDGSHPSASGAYLAACCFYAALTGGDPREVAFDGGLAADEAEFLREKARG